MSAVYAPSYIDEVLARRDALALHTVITVRARTSQLPEECSLFARTLEWLGSDWQYYEATKEEDFIELCRLLKKFEMSDVLAKYQEARLTHMDLSRWFQQNEAAIRDRIFEIAKLSVDFLKKNEG